MRPGISIPLQEIRGAQRCLASAVVRSPLLRLNARTVPGEVYLKLDNL
jgi:hypothetical protein